MHIREDSLILNVPGEDGACSKDAEFLGWDLVEPEDALSMQRALLELHKRRLELESSQARKAQLGVGKAIADVSSGDLALVDANLLEVHKLCSIPGTAVSITSLSCECPPVVQTAKEHGFFSGQVVIITGLKPLADEAEAPGAASLIRLLHRDHGIIVLDAFRFSLCGMEALPPDGERMLNFEGSEVAASIGSWALGRTPLSHSALHTTAQTVGELGLARACSVVYSAVRSSCGGVQTVADSCARHVEYARRLTPPGAKAKSLKLLHSALKRFSTLQGPELRSTVSAYWEKMVEASQPSNWARAADCIACAECLNAFAAPPESQLNAAVESDHVREDRVGKHHCRHCGRVVCDACSKDRESVPWHGYLHKVRICRACVGVVKMRNLSLQHHQNLSELLDMATAGLWHADEPPRPKGRGRGKPPGLPPPSGKGKGKAEVKAQFKAQSQTPETPKAKELKRGKGLSVLGHGMENQLAELENEFVVLQPSAPRQPGGGGLREPGLAILEGRELFPWHVARRAYEPHLPEIDRCLREISLEGASGVEEWLPALEQILPLESKVSAQTLQRLKAVESGEFGGLRVYERQICEHFLPVARLGVRLRGLYALRDLQAEQEKLETAISAARAAYLAPLAPPEEAGGAPEEAGGAPRLREEVRDFLAAMTYLTKRDDLEGLVLSTQVGQGKKLLESAWQAGEHGRTLCNAKGFMQALAPALLGPAVRPAAEMLDVLQRLLDRQRDRNSLRLASQEADDPELLKASERLERVAAPLESALESALSEGRCLLAALYQLPREALPEGLLACRELAKDLDQCVLSLRQLVQGLQDARPGVGGTSRPAAKKQAGRGSEASKSGRAKGLAKQARSKRSAKAPPSTAPGRESQQAVVRAVLREAFAKAAVSLPGAMESGEEDWASAKSVASSPSEKKAPEEVLEEEEVEEGTSTETEGEAELATPMMPPTRSLQLSLRPGSA